MTKQKIYLNHLAKEMLFGYIEGVDWVGDYTDENNNLLNEKEQDDFYSKVMDWVNSYNKLYNGKFANIEIKDNQAFNLIRGEAFAQADLIQKEVLRFSNDPADLFEEYWCYKTNKQKIRVKKKKELEHKNYIQAVKQLDKLSNLKL
tara:strand:+ start:40 stop:477 length:438 start_codon:yes stop_codon:yes gene_type:complete